jgi:hypothetical protein
VQLAIELVKAILHSMRLERVRWWQVVVTGAAKGMASGCMRGSSWVMAITGRRHGALTGLGAAAWSARLGFGDRENLFLAIFVTLSLPPSHNGQNRGLGKRKEDDGFVGPVHQGARSEGRDAL